MPIVLSGGIILLQNHCPFKSLLQSRVQGCYKLSSTNPWLYNPTWTMHSTERIYRFSLFHIVTAGGATYHTHLPTAPKGERAVQSLI